MPVRRGPQLSLLTSAASRRNDPLSLPAATMAQSTQRVLRSNSAAHTTDPESQSSDSTSSSKARCSITSLPVEILAMILGQSDYKTFNALRLTNLAFRNLSTHIPLEQILQNTERSNPPCLAVFQFPCYTCLRILPHSAFADGEWKDSKRCGGKDAPARICLLCGLHSERYPPGHAIIYRRKSQHVCKVCNEFCGIHHRLGRPGCRPQLLMDAHDPWRWDGKAAMEYNAWVRRRTSPSEFPVLAMPEDLGARAKWLETLRVVVGSGHRFKELKLPTVRCVGRRRLR